MVKPPEGGRTGPHRLAFELSGGALCLDLANTVERRGSGTPRELLRSYQDVVSWARQSGALAEQRAPPLLRRAARQPRAAAAALRRVRETREALFRVFSAAARGRSPHPDDVARLNGELRAALARRRLEARPGASFAWAWERADAALEQMLGPVLVSAAELLTGGERSRVRECAADECGWLFLDRSRNASRRWCDMSVCGNRAKARRHRGRRRGGG